eukprot:GHVS01024126.1.p1 GENE.GHVS01024126.1~~GHVS01024126.1.p1  ORF type:complete len:418 (+),score=57.95 GHVS01024126.1:1071-2324(+)
MTTVSSKNFCKRHSSFFSSFSPSSSSSRLATFSSSSPLRFFRSLLVLILLLFTFFSSLVSCWYVTEGTADWLDNGYPSSVLIIYSDYAVIDSSETPVESRRLSQTLEEPSSYSSTEASSTAYSSSSSPPRFLKTTTAQSDEELRVEPLSGPNLYKVYPGSYAEAFILDQTNHVTTLDRWSCSVALQTSVDQSSGVLDMSPSAYGSNNVVVALVKRIDYSCGLLKYDERLSSQNILVFQQNLVDTEGLPFICYPKDMEYDDGWLSMDSDDLPDNVWRIELGSPLYRSTQGSLVVGLSVGFAVPVFLILLGLAIALCIRYQENIGDSWSSFKKKARRPQAPHTVNTATFASGFWAEIGEKERKVVYAGCDVKTGELEAEADPKSLEVDGYKEREHYAKYVQSIGGERRPHKKTVLGAPS